MKSQGLTSYLRLAGKPRDVLIEKSLGSPRKS